jgi:hypothetical protein
VRDVEHAMDQLALGTKQLGINLRISSRDVKTIGDKPEKAGMKKAGWPQNYLKCFQLNKFLRLIANFFFVKYLQVKSVVKCT